MPQYVFDKIHKIMKENNIKDYSKVGLYGLTYKENVDDMRESPTLQLLDIFEKYNIDNVKILRPVIAPYRDSKGIPKDWFEQDQKKMRLTHPSNIWTDISIPFWSMSENTNHPTQKPEKLIAKLILASSDEGDVVFDPFLGSGTTAVVAKKLKRQFIGIEKEKEYVATALKRLEFAEKHPQIQGFEDGVFKPRNM
jgi:site-specific DNA-methyltransferase (adenine-specific)